MHDKYCNCCPDWNDDKNRFQPENRFVGDIEDGKRYPFDVYKKEESDARYAQKQDVYTKQESDDRYAQKGSGLDLGLVVENGMLCVKYESEG